MATKFMATKSQLKQYFGTGKIPTQAQFGELIDFFMPQPSDDAGQRSNQTLKFGQGDEIESPIINGLRTVHYKENDADIYNFWIFTNYNVNDTGIAVPLFIMFRMSDSNPGIPSSNTKFRYCIPSELEVQSWVSTGIDCDRATDEKLWNALQNFQYKDWPEGSGDQESLTINSVISEPGQYNVIAFGYDPTSLFTAFELTLARNTNKHFIVGLLKQTQYVVANGQFRPKITWFSIAGKMIGGMPYYEGSKTFDNIVSFARANLTSHTSEPNIQG